MNNFLLFIAGMLVLVLSVLFAVPPMIDWNDFRGTFEEEASRVLDREVRVRGDVSVRLLPVPYVSFEKVRIADAAGVPGSFARAERFKMWLAVPPLLRGVFEARQIELESPVIRLRTEPDGSGNWRKLQIRKDSLAYIPSEVALNSVKITDGTILFESHYGHEISRLSKISGEMTAAAISGPFRFIGAMELGGESQELRFSTASMDENGQVRFRGTVRKADNTTSHTVNGTLFDLLGRARAEGKLISRAQPQRGTGGSTGEAGYELTADVKLDTKTLQLEKIAIAFRNNDRQQTLHGSAVTSWREGVITETNLSARWLDFDTIAGTSPGDGPLKAVERLLTRGIEPLGTGVTSVSLKVDQANLAGTAISDLTGRLVRRDNVTNIKSLRVSLPGLSAMAIDGFLERRETGLQFDGNVLLRSASFAELAQWGGAGLSKSSQRALATPFSLSSSVRLRPKRIELTGAHVRLADATAEGDFAYSWAGRRVLAANIDADKLELEKFGRNMLAPDRVARLMGFQPKTTVASEGEGLFGLRRDTDITLKLRANRMSDELRKLTDVDIEFTRDGDALALSKVNLNWDGLQLLLAGKLDQLSKQPRGHVSGTVSSTGANGGRRLAELLSLATGRTLPVVSFTERASLRAAIDARLGTADGADNSSPYTNQVIVDGIAAGDRIRLDARSTGSIANWQSEPVKLAARITGADALATSNWLFGLAIDGGPTRGEPGQSGGVATPMPVTIVMNALGTPSKSMNIFARISGGTFLDADFAGQWKLGHDEVLTASWNGNLDIRHTTTRNLALMAWPLLVPRIPALAVKGRLAIARNMSGHSIEPRGVTVGPAVIDGKLTLAMPELAKNSTATPGKPPSLTGSLSLSNAHLPALLNVAMRPSDAPDDKPESTGESIWPDTPFDFALLDTVRADLDFKVGTLSLQSATRMRNAQFKVANVPGSISIKEFAARLDSGTIKGGADLKKMPAGASLTANLAGSGLKLAIWAPKVAAAKRLAGSADFNLNVSGQALSPLSLASSLSGKGEIRLNEVTVPGVTAEAVTNVARRIIDGEIEVEALMPELEELAQNEMITLGSPKLKVRIASGTMSFPSIVFKQDIGGLKNITVVDLPRWQIDSQWTVTPAPQPKPDAPGQTVALPPIAIVYAGSIAGAGDIMPAISPGDLERELIVRKMEANVARLERLRREDEARAAAERERQRLIEEEQQRAIEEERRRREHTNLAPGQTSPPVPVAPPQPARPQ